MKFKTYLKYHRLWRQRLIGKFLFKIGVKPKYSESTGQLNIKTCGYGKIGISGFFKYPVFNFRKG